MVISNSISVAANSLSANIFEGEQFSFLTKTSLLVFRLSAAVTGMRLNFTVGGVSIADNALVSDSNRFPILPDDVLVTVGGQAGERLFATLRNTTGAAIVTEYALDIN